MIIIKSNLSNCDDMLSIFNIELSQRSYIFFYFSAEIITLGYKTIRHITRMKSNRCFESWVFLSELDRCYTWFNITCDRNTSIIAIFSKKMLQNWLWRFFKSDIGMSMSIEKHRLKLELRTWKEKHFTIFILEIYLNWI